MLLYRLVEASWIAATLADPRGRPARAEGATSAIDVAIRLAAVGILVKRHRIIRWLRRDDPAEPPSAKSGGGG